MTKVHQQKISCLVAFSAIIFSCAVARPNSAKRIGDSANSSSHLISHIVKSTDTMRYPEQNDSNSISEVNGVITDTMRYPEQNDSNSFSEVNGVISDRVRFSATKPLTPPTSLTDIDNANIVNNRTISSKSRRRRNLPRIHSRFPLLSVCDSVSDWVRISEAENMFGNRVKLVQTSKTGQYFYETYCKKNPSCGQSCSCRGIDPTKYDSTCEERHIWVLGKTIENGNENVDFIKIRASCSCGLIAKG